MLQDGWQYVTWLHHQSLGEKSIFYLYCFVIIEWGKRLGKLSQSFFHRGCCSTVYWALGIIIQSIFWKMKRTWVTASILIRGHVPSPTELSLHLWPQKSCGSPIWLPVFLRNIVTQWLLISRSLQDKHLFLSATLQLTPVKCTCGASLWTELFQNCFTLPAPCFFSSV